MKSLAYLVAFILGCVVIGGPLALGLTFLRVGRYKATVTKGVVAILLACVSILFSLILILNSGSIGSKILGFIGLATAIPAITRSIRSVRNFR
jgi:hypothetical protein